MTVAMPAQLVSIDIDACNRLADYLATRNIPIDREDTSLPGIDRALVADFYFVLVAICHQTSPRGRAALEGTIAGQHKRGWDYLLGRLEQAATRDPSLLSPTRLSQLTTDDMRFIFRDLELGDRLSDPELRAELLRDIGVKLLRAGWSSINQAYRLCDGRIMSGHPNLLDTLSSFRAYSDPVRKKSVFFLALMRNSGLWAYRDDEHLGPPVDYHEVRGHLRLGTVVVNNSSLLKKLEAGERVTPDEDVAIRLAVHDAIMYVSGRSGLRNPSQLHYLFWNVFRSVCTRSNPQCFSLSADNTLPERYVPLAVETGPPKCPFATFCKSAGCASPICEHVFETDFY